MALTEINFDGIIGPSHNYAGLSLGNLASQRNAGEESQPRAAALQGIDKMRANLALGLAQGLFVPQPRPNRAWLAELGTSIEQADPALAANALSASAMWAANAATVSPAPDTADHRCHLTVANLRTMAHRSHEWPATLAHFGWRSPTGSIRGPRPGPAGFGDEGAANHMRLTAGHGEPGVESSSTACRAARFRRGSILRRRTPSPAATSSTRSGHCSPSSQRTRSPPARSTMTSSPSPTSGCCSPTKKRLPTRRR